MELAEVHEKALEILHRHLGAYVNYIEFAVLKFELEQELPGWEWKVHFEEGRLSLSHRVQVSETLF